MIKTLNILKKSTIITLLCYSFLNFSQIKLMTVHNLLTAESNPTTVQSSSGGAPAVRFYDSGIPIISQWLGKPRTLPVTIMLEFADNKIYYLTIRENPECGKCSQELDKICVTATVSTAPDLETLQGSEYQQHACVSKAVFAIKKGDDIYKWQNVVLFLADETDPGKKEILPFKFGIAAWTSTEGVWAYDFVSEAPADPITKAPAVLLKNKL